MSFNFNQYKPLFQPLGRASSACAKVVGIFAGFYGIYKLWTEEGRSKHPLRGRLTLSFFYMLHISALYLSSLVLLGSLELLSPAAATLLVCSGSFIKNMYDLSLEMYHNVRLSRKMINAGNYLARLGFDITENSDFIRSGKLCITNLGVLETLIENQKKIDNNNIDEMNHYRKILTTQIIRVKTDIEGLINFSNPGLSLQKHQLPDIFSKLRILLETREKMRLIDLDRYSKHKTTLFSLSMMIIAVSLYFTVTASTLPLLPEIMLCLGIFSGISNCFDVWTKITTKQALNAERADQMHLVEQLLEEEAMENAPYKTQRLTQIMVDLSNLLAPNPKSNDSMTESRRSHIPQYQRQIKTRSSTTAELSSVEKMVQNIIHRNLGLSN